MRKWGFAPEAGPDGPDGPGLESTLQTVRNSKSIR